MIYSYLYLYLFFCLCLYLYFVFNLIEGGVCCADDDLNGGDEEINQPTAEPRKLGLPRVDIHLIIIHDDDDHDDVHDS